MQLTVQLPVQLACNTVQLAWRPPPYNPPWGGTPHTGLHALRAHHPPSRQNTRAVNTARPGAEAIDVRPHEPGKEDELEEEEA